MGAATPFTLALAVLCAHCGPSKSTATPDAPAPTSQPTTANTSSSKLTCPVGMALLPSGQFTMGPELGGDTGREPLALPAHDVSITAFYIDLTETSEAQFQACKSCGPPPPRLGCSNGRSDLPAVCLSHSQAAIACSERSMRLPTEEEWEYAARGKEGREYPWGSRWPVSSLCVSDRGHGAPGDLCPVGSSKDDRTPEGVLDMEGNAKEWTGTAACDARMKPCQNGFVLRGNSASDVAPLAVVDAREVFDDRVVGFGFRCVASPDKHEGRAQK